MFQQVDRFQVAPPSEVRPYLLSPEESRTYFKPREEKQTWYDFCLMDHGNIPFEKFRAQGKVFFISKDANDRLVCSFLNNHGELEAVRTEFTVTGPLTITAEIKEHILERAIRSRQIPASSEVMYRGIPCYTDTECTPELEEIASALPSYQVKYFTVPQGSIGKLMVNDRPVFVRPGKHIFMESNVRECGYESLSNKRINHGNRCIITVGDEEYVYARDPASPEEDYKLLTTGIHVLDKQLTLININEPYGLDVKVRFEDGTEKLLFAKVPQGKIGVALDQDPRSQAAPLEERLHILDQGVNAMNTVFPREALDARVSSKMGNLECDLTASNQAGKPVQIHVKLQYRLDKNNVFYTYQRFYNRQIKDSITKSIEEIVSRELRKVVASSINVSEENALPEDSIRALNHQFLRLPMEVESIQEGTLRYRKMNLQGQISREDKARIEAEALRQYGLLSSTPGITANTLVTALNDKLKDDLGEPMVTIGKVTYSMHPLNLADEQEQDFRSIARIQEEQREHTESFKLEMRSMQQQNAALSHELDELQHVNHGLDEVLAARLQEFMNTNPDVRQTLENIQEEKPVQGQPNRNRFMSVNPNLNREGSSQAQQANCPVS